VYLTSQAFLERHCNLDDAHRQAASLVWGCYHVPDDCRPWLLRFIAMAERFPACIVLRRARRDVSASSCSARIIVYTLYFILCFPDQC